MIIAGHQPEYMPYLGFFYKIAKADKFIFVDHVQFQRKGLKKEFFQNRNRIRTAPGSNGFTWMTVPILSGSLRFQKIYEIKIDNSTGWAEKHWKTIFLNYKKAPFFNLYEDFFRKLYEKKWDMLADLNEAIILYILKELKIEKPIFRSSDYDFKDQKTDLLVEMCKEFNADTYLSGVGAKVIGYVEDDKFEANNLKHIFSDFKHPVYPQKYKPFVPNMSVIDLLFNCGPESKKIIEESCL